MASSPFLEDFDTLLNGILKDYQNQFPDADVSKGTLIFIKSACLASARWGLSKKIDWAAKQIFPDTADTNNMYHHAWVHGLSQNPGESDSAYLARLLNDIQQPPAGGNANDFDQWALGVAGVGKAYCKVVLSSAITLLPLQGLKVRFHQANSPVVQKDQWVSCGNAH